MLINPDFQEEARKSLQSGAPITGALIIFAHLFFIGADLGFPEADFMSLLRYRIAGAALFTFLTVIALTKWGQQFRRIKILSMLIIGLCAVSVSNLTTMTGGSASPYWTMIMLTYFGGTLILRLSPLEAGITYGMAFLYHSANMLYFAGDNPRSPEFFTNIFGLLLALLVSLTGNWYIRRLQQREFQSRQSLAKANEQLQQSVTELQYKRQQEQLRYLQNKLDLANDLHDTVGAQLSQIVVMAQQNRIESTAHLKALAQSSLENVRNFAHLLKGEERIAGLDLQLARLAQSLKALGRYDVNFTHPQEDFFLSDIVLLNLDRILSEWTANAIRHASATAFSLGAKQKRGKVIVWFYQNQTPFTWRGHAERGGLKSIAMRTQTIGARVKVCSRKKGALFILIFRTGTD